MLFIPMSWDSTGESKTVFKGTDSGGGVVNVLLFSGDKCDQLHNNNIGPKRREGRPIKRTALSAQKIILFRNTCEPDDKWPDLVVLRSFVRSRTSHNIHRAPGHCSAQGFQLSNYVLLGGSY